MVGISGRTARARGAVCCPTRRARWRRLGPALLFGQCLASSLTSVRPARLVVPTRVSPRVDRGLVGPRPRRVAGSLAPAPDPRAEPAGACSRRRMRSPLPPAPHHLAQTFRLRNCCPEAPPSSFSPLTALATIATSASSVLVAGASVHAPPSPSPHALLAPACPLSTPLLPPLQTTALLLPHAL